MNLDILSTWSSHGKHRRSSGQPTRMSSDVSVGGSSSDESSTTMLGTVSSRNGRELRNPSVKFDMLKAWPIEREVKLGGSDSAKASKWDICKPSASRRTSSEVEAGLQKPSTTAER